MDLYRIAIPKKDNLLGLRLLILAIGVGAALELIALMFALHASELLYRLSYWIVYHSVDFATITNSEMQAKMREKQIVDMLSHISILRAGLLFH